MTARGLCALYQYIGDLVDEANSNASIGNGVRGAVGDKIALWRGLGASYQQRAAVVGVNGDAMAP